MGIQAATFAPWAYMRLYPGPRSPVGTYVACMADSSDPAFPSRGPWLPNGFCCPAGSWLTMASSEPLASTWQLISFARQATRPRVGPHFYLHLFPVVPSPGPRRTDQVLPLFFPDRAAFASFALARRPLNPATDGSCGDANEA